MPAFRLLVEKMRALRGDTRGQDFVEYSLVAAFAAILIGAIMPYPFLGSLQTIYSRLMEVFHRLVPV